jgi:hypothetical protein
MCAGRPTSLTVSPPCTEARRGSFDCLRWIAERSQDAPLSWIAPRSNGRIENVCAGRPTSLTVSPLCTEARRGFFDCLRWIAERSQDAPVSWIAPRSNGRIENICAGRSTSLTASPLCTEARRGSLDCLRWIAERSTTMAVRHCQPLPRCGPKLGEALLTASVGSRSDPRLWSFDTGNRFPAVSRSSARLSRLPPLDRGAIHDYGRPTLSAASPLCVETRRGSLDCLRWIAERSTTMAVRHRQPLSRRASRLSQRAESRIDTGSDCQIIDAVGRRSVGQAV